MLGLGIIFKVLLLIANAMAVLHEERFLKKGNSEKTLLTILFVIQTNQRKENINKEEALCQGD